MNISSDDIRIERLTRKFFEDEFTAAQQSVEHTFPWMEWCHANLTRGELETTFVSIEKAWEQGEAYTFAILNSASMISSERSDSIGSMRQRKPPICTTGSGQDIPDMGSHLKPPNWWCDSAYQISRLFLQILMEYWPTDNSIEAL